MAAPQYILVILVFLCYVTEGTLRSACKQRLLIVVLLFIYVLKTFFRQ